MPNVKPRPVKKCVTCESEFNPSHPRQEACSRACIPKKGRQHLTCPCGVNTGSYQKKYCCPEHREKWGKKKPPPRMITYTCLGCGDDFERPHWYPNKKKYCSNACSHRQVKKVRDKFIADLPDGAVVFHSMWEVRFVAACERFDIPWRSYDGPDIVTSEGIYRPDFIINTTTVVDVKGWLRPESAVKIDQARAQGLSVVTITKEDLLALECGTPSLVSGAALL